MQQVVARLETLNEELQAGAGCGEFPFSLQDFLEKLCGEGASPG